MKSTWLKGDKKMGLSAVQKALKAAGLDPDMIKYPKEVNTFGMMKILMEENRALINAVNELIRQRDRKEDEGMQVKEYVRRYYDAVVKKRDGLAIDHMLTDLLAECNAELGASYGRNPSDADVGKCIAKFNRKGNTIADRFNEMAGEKIVKHDWFKSCVAMRIADRIMNYKDLEDAE